MASKKSKSVTQTQHIYLYVISAFIVISISMLVIDHLLPLQTTRETIKGQEITSRKRNRYQSKISTNVETASFTLRLSTVLVNLDTDEVDIYYTPIFHYPQRIVIQTVGKPFELKLSMTFWGGLVSLAVISLLLVGLAFWALKKNIPSFVDMGALIALALTILLWIIL